MTFVVMLAGADATQEEQGIVGPLVSSEKGGLLESR